MIQSISHFIFKPAAESQRELIHQWIKQDYIQEWVHGQGLENLLKGLDKFLQYQAQGKGLDRETEITQHWIGYDREKPFVYLLTSKVLKNVESEYAKYSDKNGLAITLDIFICDKNYLGKNLAATIIKEFLTSHFSDVSEIFIDPEQSNARAVHVYQKVGFKIVGEFIASWHPVPHYLMKMKMSEL